MECHCYGFLYTFAVRYIAKLEDGTIFEKRGFDGEASLEFITDEGGFLTLHLHW